MSDAISIRRFTWLVDQRGFTYVNEHRLQDAITVRREHGHDVDDWLGAEREAIDR